MQAIKQWVLRHPNLTAWIALSDSTPANGCMRVVPGTQDADQLPHADTFAKDNLLSRGQEIAVEVDETKAALIAAMHAAKVKTYRDDAAGILITLADGPIKVAITEVDPEEAADDEPAEAAQ